MRSESFRKGVKDGIPIGLGYFAVSFTFGMMAVADGLLVPVEVKANRNRSKSLRQLISGDSYGDIHWGIKLADSNVGIEDGIYTFPYFCTFLLKRYLRGK